MLKEAVCTLQQPRGQGSLSELRGRNGVDGQDLFVPAPTGQQGEQQAHCAPKSALQLSTRTVLLGLPRRSLAPSRLDELSECAGGMNRLLHVLMTWPVRVDPLAGPRAQAQGP